MANSYALNFNGSSRITFGRDVMNVANTLTLEFWMNTTSSDYSTYRSVVSNRDGSSATANYEVGSIVNSGNMFFYNGTVYDMGYKPPLNTWIHIAYKLVNNTLEFYVNGTLSKTVAGVTLGRATSMDFAIGAISSGGIQPYIGKLDDVRLWNTAKSSDEILNNYKKNLSGTEDGLIGYFPFEEGVGSQTINKKSGSTLVGTINSPAWITAEVELYSYKFLISLENKYQSLSYDNRDLIPKMTSDTLPSGIASCSTTFSTSGAYNAFNAFDKTITQTGSFNSWVTASGQLTGWLAYEFPSATVVNKYTLVHGYNNVNVAPKSWTFEGTNDNGLTWTVLDQRNNVTDWILWTEKEFEFVNLKKFKKYRINITLNNGNSSYVGIQEMKMYDTNRTLLFCPSVSEENFIKYGLNKNEVIETYKQMSKKSYLTTSSTQIGSGKVFKQKVDTSKIPIKKALII
ncbi:LamG-like jellyroll fold domain-containing protein [Paenibacillus silvae]|uniref:LamG-like jellyroll fold domain-containing protein n=1 Tax=Paenibacillus silvae TaxID=1325358 RepID=A0A2W6QK24_9BACL|nr:LamG-like jellyroll fold domain-containing protein [Paenibacillus silvae]PZT57523.1 hypothetical protein DN757_02395 [Paenibacillus silvae]